VDVEQSAVELRARRRLPGVTLRLAPSGGGGKPEEKIDPKWASRAGIYKRIQGRLKPCHGAALGIKRSNPWRSQTISHTVLLRSNIFGDNTLARAVSLASIPAGILR
jgi:hypothetical protein